MVRPFLLGITLLLAACVSGGPTSFEPSAPGTTYEVVGAGPDLVRVWGDATEEEIARDSDAIRARILARIGSGPRSERAEYLAISGGGADGAFGAGLLKGWTDAGTRPEFEVVTGVSTGALIAPFAFLGPDYDDALRAFYTETETADILSLDILSGLFGGTAFASATPLEARIEDNITMDLMDAIASEYERGRFLLVGTTNLAVGRPVIWDMGSIAIGRNDEALELFRKVILASASIPVLFPPVTLDVETASGPAQEIHVDGGTTENAILAPISLSLDEILPKGRRPASETLYVIINGKTRSEWQPVRASAFGIAELSMTTLLRQRTRGDIRKLRDFASQNGLAFRITTIPQGFQHPTDGMFDREYMNALYQTGLSLRPYRHNRHTMEQNRQRSLSNAAFQPPFNTQRRAGRRRRLVRSLPRARHDGCRHTHHQSLHWRS